VFENNWLRRYCDPLLWCFIGGTNRRTRCLKTETDVRLRQVGGGYERKLVLMLNRGSGATGEAPAAACEAQQQVNE